MEEKKGLKILESCYKSAEHENVIWVCDGAANVGQIGHAVGVLLTNLDKARMCCTTAVAASSKPHLDIAEKAKKNIVINGCSNRCASKLWRKLEKELIMKLTYQNICRKYPHLTFMKQTSRK
ncbi:MAG: putative zinc-binding protein [Candidatus Bathyarchaeia archaeon]